MESLAPSLVAEGETRPEHEATDRSPRWVLRVLAIYLGSRLVVLMGALVAALIAPPLRGQDWTFRWDSFWYLQIAQHGYPTGLGPLSPERPYNANAFFPLWPMTVRAATFVFAGHFVVAAYVTNFLLGALLALLVRRLFVEFADPSTADLGVALFLFFPGTNVFSAAYSEPLALCLAAAALLALVQRRWVTAGLLCALAGAARPPVALAVLVAACWAVAVAMRRGERRALATITLAPAGVVAFLLFQWQRTGAPFAFHTVEDRLFQHRLDLGLSFYRGVVRPALHDPRGHAAGLAVTVIIGTVLLLVLAIAYARRPTHPVLGLYSLVVLAPVVVDSALLPKVRFVAAAFPLFLPLAKQVRGLTAGVILGVESALLCGFTVLNLVAWLAFP